MLILAIDPGTKRSSWCLFDYFTLEPQSFGTALNQDILFKTPDYEQLVIEMIACYGMPVGEEVFNTCLWIGRFIERNDLHMLKSETMTIPRMDVKMNMCHSAKATDSNIRQALIDIYGPKGRKKNPGILHGIKKDEWQALALAYTYSEIRRGKEETET